MADEKPESFDSKLRIDFIDPLFAVAIHIGVVDGLLREEWFDQHHVPSRIADYANLCLFVAGLWLLVLSWLGYHQSIRRKPILGDARFILDIALLMLYIALLLYFRDPASVAILVFAIFVIYALWDFYKTKEYKPAYYNEAAPNLFVYLGRCLAGWLYPSSYPTLVNEAVTVGWAVFFLILIPFSFLSATETDSGKLSLGLIVITATTLYRFDKKHAGAWIRSIPFKIFMGAAVAYIVLYATKVLCF